jgi:anhydro-N-acetylmuramic acid kinase
MADREYLVAGMMSGTSLDGMDLILSRFYKGTGHWRFTIEKALTIDYTGNWKERLEHAAGLDAETFIMLHQEYGRFIGAGISQFLMEHGLSAELIASHGHTIFHQPGKGLTFQLGDGASVASQCNLTTVSDFRTLDVALGGQGAPLVPVGDELLFPQYRYCLNLGGFANISCNRDGKRIAWDICPVNIVLNTLARELGQDYDAFGKSGRQGLPNIDLISELNKLAFYSITGPKSLGREWVETMYMPVLSKFNIPLEDLMRSVYEHTAIQIGRCMNRPGEGEALVTGGGAFNTFLMERISEQTCIRLVIPDTQLVKFKEALIFAFLGLLRFRNETNCLASVTGAKKDSSSGIIHLML